ncbi:rRNA maturation RNase YbeY [Haloimpatiens lingqiaonensis]|uniref:rRNA maturation RNase YbeY n=1 Tax=Haloimpatiens lingqiaonensis TaxID=1380675 RepID=UPI0010FE1230|nr:rRNA maturation RNase YbeY [Haloimpatiens lingqiaonensis]
MLYIDNRQEKIIVDEQFESTLENIIKYTLKEEKVNLECEISILFVDNEAIREINNEQRGIDRETDVLSFPMLDYPEGKVYKEVYLENSFDDSYFDEGKLVLGDIVLSLEKGQVQSEEYGHSFLRECCYLTVHSVLHLLGYDHMIEEDKRKMREREEEILNKFNIIR